VQEKDRMAPDRVISQLESAIGYRFRERELLSTALVHVSVAGDGPDADAISNERLEFLGDAVIELVVSQALYEANPDWDEGELTEARASFVTTHTLAEAAYALDLGAYLALGRGEERTGGRGRVSNLADAFEALCGAIYLDGGLDAVRAFVATHLVRGRDLARKQRGRDPKTVLQERLQGVGRPHPQYRQVEAAGPDHRPTFVSEVVSDGEVLGRGSGGSKRAAEREAAADALSRLDAPRGGPAG
jgi:ribonuclease-3